MANFLRKNVRADRFVPRIKAFQAWNEVFGTNEDQADIDRDIQAYITERVGEINKGFNND